MSPTVAQEPDHKPITTQDIPFGEQFFRRLFDNLYDGVYFVNSERRILFWNIGAERLTGFSANEVLGSYCYENILNHVDESGRHLCLDSCPLVQAVTSGTPTSKRVYLQHKDGRQIAIDVHVMPLRDDAGKIIGGVEIFRDASSSVALETAYDKLRELAEKDPLTGVANRRHLDQILESQLGLLQQTGIPFSLIMADIDHFKQVNDTWGHATGDKALIAFADRLRTTCRRNDTLGRWGGEEFLIILPGQQLLAASGMAVRLRGAVSTCAPKEIREHGLTGSFGVTEAVLGDTIAGLLMRVDDAMYRAKSLGRNRVEISSPPETTPRVRQ